MAIGTPKTAHSYAYESLRTQILTGDLKPGSPLIQANIAKELGVSMTPVREALRDLSTEGLVTLSPHRGATVTVLDLEDAKEIHRIRLKLEPDATRMAVEHLVPTQLDDAEVLYSQMSSTDDGQFAACNREFHTVLLSSAPSRRLRAILNSLLEAAALYVPLAVAHRVGPDPQLEHRRILDAYRSGNAEAAAEAVTAHIHSSISSLEWTAPDDRPTESST